MSLFENQGHPPKKWSHNGGVASVRTTVVCKCKAQMRRRVTSNLSNMCLGLVTVLELSGGVRCVAKCLSISRNWRKCVPRQSQPLRLGGTVLASQNSVLGQESLISARALVRPGVVITYVSTSQLLAGRQLSSLGTGAVKRSLWLRVVRLINLARCCSRAKSSKESEIRPRKVAV